MTFGKDTTTVKDLCVFAFTVLFFLIPADLLAQGAAHTGTVRDPSGGVVSGAEVAVCNYPATPGTPCAPLASLYSDAALTQAISNPIVSDSNGNYSFFAAPGTYVIQISGSSISTQTSTITLASPASRIGGVYRVGSHTYPCTAAGINTAISAAIANNTGSWPGGVVDARACMGNLTMSGSIIVGNSSSDPVTLLLPTAAVWTFTVSGSTACDIEQFPNTAIEGPPGGGGGAVGKMLIQSAVGASPYANFCTAGAFQTGSYYGYYHDGGFVAYNPNATTTTSGYAVVIISVADDTTFSNIGTGDGTNNGILIAHACCGASFYNLTANSGDTGGVPLTIGNGVKADNSHEINFFGGSFDHAKIGDSEIVFNEPAYVGGPINFYGIYMEGNTNSPDTAPFINTGPNGVAYGVNFYGLTVFPMQFENVYGIYVPSTGHIKLFVSGMYMRSSMDPNAIQDERHGVTIAIPTHYGQVPTYDSSGVLTANGLTGLVPVTAEKGTVALTSGSGSVSLGFVHTPICTATDTTGPNAVKATATAKTLAVTGTGSDVISYICIGNPN